MRDISNQSLSASLSSLAISSATTSANGAFPSRTDTVDCCGATAAAEVSDSQTKADINVDKTTRKNPAVAVSENSAADSTTNCCQSDMTSITSSSLPSSYDEGYKESDAVRSVLYLLHGLSHCSYHEPSLLVLAEHAAFNAAVDLFVYLWHKLQTSQQQHDPTQARIFEFCV